MKSWLFRRVKSHVKRIVTYDGDLKEAFCPQCVTLTLEDEIDISRGEMLVHPDNVPEVRALFRDDARMDGRRTDGS